MVFARSVIRARICKLFPRQLLSTQTPRGCMRDAQLVPSLFKLLKTSYSHQGPFWLRAHGYWGSARLLGKPMLENQVFGQLRFVSAAGPWLHFSRHSHHRGSCQGQADGSAAGAKICLNMSRTCTRWLAPSPTLAWSHLLTSLPLV